MSRIRDAWARVSELKDGSPPLTNPLTIASTADTGEAFVRAVMARHGLDDRDLDELVLIDRRVGSVTITNLLMLTRTGKLELADVLMIVHASGMTNGLALGLELKR